MARIFSNLRHPAPIGCYSLTRPAERKLPQRDHQPVEVGGDNQSHLAALQRQHCAVLVSQYDPARAWTDRHARAGSAVYAIHVKRTSDVADLTEKIGR